MSRPTKEELKPTPEEFATGPIVWKEYKNEDVDYISCFFSIAKPFWDQEEHAWCTGTFPDGEIYDAWIARWSFNSTYEAMLVKRTSKNNGRNKIIINRYNLTLEEAKEIIIEKFIELGYEFEEYEYEELV